MRTLQLCMVVDIFEVHTLILVEVPLTYFQGCRRGLKITCVLLAYSVVGFDGQEQQSNNRGSCPIVSFPQAFNLTILCYVT